MLLRTRFTEDMKDAMRARETQRVSAIRLIIAKMKEADVEARGAGRGEASEPELLAMLQKMIKQRRDSIEAYVKGNREDLADQERAEIVVITHYLPKQMSEDEAKAAIAAAVSELGASGVKDMGKVIARLKEQFTGQMDFGKASGLVKAALGG
ncbi:MAG TPA: glutamyl-tRNA amidotransferase [Alphaproteobacteria bacterium]|nr:glutamyl-tRNA amidotransferase [Alphaproteobacteria bacterium]